MAEKSFKDRFKSFAESAGLASFDEPAQAQQQSQPAQSASAPSSYAPQVSDPMIETLKKVILARKTSYTALIDASAKLQAVIPDETQRLKAAFITIAGDGQRSFNDIIKAIDVHIADLDGELSRFNKTSDDQLNAKAGTLRSQAQTLMNEVTANKSSIEKYQAEITKLTARNNDAETQARQLSTSADQAEADVKQVSAKFAAAVESVSADLKLKKQSLATVLTP